MIKKFLNYVCPGYLKPEIEFADGKKKRAGSATTEQSPFWIKIFRLSPKGKNRHGRKNVVNNKLSYDAKPVTSCRCDHRTFLPRKVGCRLVRQVTPSSTNGCLLHEQDFALSNYCNLLAMRRYVVAQKPVIERGVTKYLNVFPPSGQLKFRC